MLSTAAHPSSRPRQPAAQRGATREVRRAGPGSGFGADIDIGSTRAYQIIILKGSDLGCMISNENISDSCIESFSPRRDLSVRTFDTHPISEKPFTFHDE